MTKNWKLVFGGRPCTLTSMSSTGPMGLISTVPLASGRQAFAPAETTMSKVVEFFGAAAVSGDTSSSTSPPEAAKKKYNLLNMFISPFSRCRPSPQTEDAFADPSRSRSADACIDWAIQIDNCEYRHSASVCRAPPCDL